MLAFLFSLSQLHSLSSCSLTLYYRCGYCCNISFCLMIQGHFKYSVFFSASVHLGVYFTFCVCVLCILSVLAKILSTHVQTSVFVLLCVLKGIIHTEYWSLSQQIWPTWPHLRSLLCSVLSHVFPHTFCLWKCCANSSKFNFVIVYKGHQQCQNISETPIKPMCHQHVNVHHDLMQLRSLIPLKYGLIIALSTDRISRRSCFMYDFCVSGGGGGVKV